MGDAADDAHDSEMRFQERHSEMLAAGCRVCDTCGGACIIYTNGGGSWHDCPTCKCCGWLDKDGDPVEP